jgi:cystathionine beta-lyase/cystathionine gamma-synthase
MHVKWKLMQIGVGRETTTGAVSFPIHHSTAYRQPPLGQSTGGVELLNTYPVTQSQSEGTQVIRKKVGVCDRLLSLSVGVEHVDDLIADLRQVLDASCEAGGKCR